MTDDIYSTVGRVKSTKRYFTVRRTPASPWTKKRTEIPTLSAVQLSIFLNFSGQQQQVMFRVVPSTAKASPSTVLEYNADRHERKQQTDFDHTKFMLLPLDWLKIDLQHSNFTQSMGTLHSCCLCCTVLASHGCQQSNCLIL